MACQGCKRRREAMKTWLNVRRDRAGRLVAVVSRKTDQGTVKRIKPSQAGTNTAKKADTSAAMAQDG